MVEPTDFHSDMTRYSGSCWPYPGRDGRLRYCGERVGVGLRGRERWIGGPEQAGDGRRRSTLVAGSSGYGSFTLFQGVMLQTTYPDSTE